MKYFLSLLFAGIALSSCTDDNTTTNPPITADTLISNTIIGVQPDTMVSKYAYFSFDNDSIVSPTLANTDAWDIRLPYLYGGGKTRSIDIQINSGLVNSVGRTMGILADTTYDFLTTAPADALLKAEDTSKTTRIIPIALDGTSMFMYNPQAFTINPVPQKTLVVKTKAGKYVKFQVLSLYKGQPATPTMYSELGYYSFRYVKSNSRKFTN